MSFSKRALAKAGAVIALCALLASCSSLSPLAAPIKDMSDVVEESPPVPGSWEEVEFFDVSLAVPSDWAVTSKGESFITLSHKSPLESSVTVHKDFGITDEGLIPSAEYAIHSFLTVDKVTASSAGGTIFEEEQNNYIKLNSQNFGHVSDAYKRTSYLEIEGHSNKIQGTISSILIVDVPDGGNYFIDIHSIQRNDDFLTDKDIRIIESSISVARPSGE